MATRPISGENQEFSLPITREQYFQKLAKVDSLIAEIKGKNLISTSSGLVFKREMIPILLASKPNAIVGVMKELEEIINLANTILSKDKKIEASESEVKVGSSKTYSDSSSVKTMSPKQIKEKAIEAQKAAKGFIEDLNNEVPVVAKEIEDLSELFKIAPGEISSRFDNVVKNFENIKESLKTLSDSLKKINQDVDFSNELQTLNTLTDSERIAVKDSRVIAKELSSIKEEITKLKKLSVNFRDVASMVIIGKHSISKLTSEVEILNSQVKDAENNLDFVNSKIGKTSITDAKKALKEVIKGIDNEINSMKTILGKLSYQTIPEEQKKLVKEMTDIKSKISQLEDDISNINLEAFPKKIKTTFTEVGKGLLSTGSKPSKEFIDDRLDLDKDPLDDLEEST